MSTNDYTLGLQHQSTGAIADPLVAVESLAAGYDGRAVVRDLSFSVRKGEFVGIAGPNGAGKTTILKALAGLVNPLSGAVRLNGQPPSAYGRRALARMVAFVFQDFVCPYEFSVFDMVTLGRSPYLPRWKPLPSKDRRIVEHAMQLTDTIKLRDRPFHELSDGERQLVVVAKALAQQPKLLLLDEPATHLDIYHQVCLFKILSQLNLERDVTIVCVTHDLSLAGQYVDRFILLKEGRLLADGPAEKVLQKSTLESLYNVPLQVIKTNDLKVPYIIPCSRDL